MLAKAQVPDTSPAQPAAPSLDLPMGPLASHADEVFDWQHSNPPFGVD